MGSFRFGLQAADSRPFESQAHWHAAAGVSAGRQWAETATTGAAFALTAAAGAIVTLAAAGAAAAFEAGQRDLHSSLGSHATCTYDGSGEWDQNWRQ